MNPKEQDSYRALRAICSERTNSILAWVGSGLSAPAQMPTWPKLRQALEATLADKIRSLDKGDALKLSSRFEQIQRVPNPWVAFQQLEDSLGNRSFRDTVREALAGHLDAKPPRVYELLWRSQIGGILNLNLDRLATRAHSEVHPGKALHEFYGRDAGGYAYLLKSQSPFIVNLHGVAEDAFSWVLTHRSLKDLLETPGYLNFISSAIVSRTILFLGVTADDLATGGHLARLTREDTDPGVHFWITSRSDIDTDRWAENAGIRVIRYEPTGAEHRELEDLISNLFTLVSSEPVALPVTLSHPDEAGPLPGPTAILSKPADEIRRILNAQAAAILQEHRPESVETYNAFCQRYDQAIYRAWYVTTEESNNILLGYKLINEVDSGAFARVFEAQSPDGERVAVKILHEELRRKRGMLEAFRRGVRSMRILSDHQVAGMVSYREASEIPALAVMDFIEGPNLRQAVQSNYIPDWPTILRVAVDLARIVRRGHLLPERVLHRDIRPSNVMLKGYYADPTNWEVVVLDFDLSWHRGAFGASVIGTNPGYLAPEQLGELRGVSTRNAAVDSFGFGMTLLYICRGEEPSAGEYQREGWPQQVERQLRLRRSSDWQSLPNRLSRLIVNATKYQQAERWDMSQIERELDRLHDALSPGQTVDSAELWAEELAERSGLGTGYSWREDTITASVILPSGLEVRLAAKETDRKVALELSWASKGVEDRRKLGKWIGRAVDQALAALRRGGWEPAEPSVQGQSVFAAAYIPVGRVRLDSSAEVSRAIRAAVDHLTFS
jgi:serine/threonine protein kinase